MSTDLHLSICIAKFSTLITYQAPFTCSNHLWKHQSNVWNLFKVNNKDTRTTPLTYFEIRNNKECCILYKTFHKTRLLLSLDSFIVIFNMIWNKNYRLRRHYLLKSCHVIYIKKKKSYLIKCNKCSNSNVTNMCNLSFLIWFISLCLNFIPADNYMFKVRNKKTKTRFEMLKVNNRDIRTTPMGLLWCLHVTFEHISHLVLVFLLLARSR